MNRPRLFLFLLPLCLSSCIKPHKPAAVPAEPAPPPTVSTLILPVHVPLAELRAYLDAHLATQPGAKGIYWVSGMPLASPVGNLHLQLGIHRAAPVGFSVAGNSLLWHIRLAVNSGRLDWDTGRVVRVSHHFEFGGGAALTGTTSLTVLPDWTLKSATSTSLNWTQNPWIDLNPPFGHIKVSIADKVQPKVAPLLASAGAKIDQAVAGVPLRAMAAKGWAALGQPLQLSDNPKAYLRIVPLAAGFGGIEGQGDDVVIKTMFSGRLIASLGPDAGSVPTPLPLPENTVLPGNPGLDILVSARADYAEMKRQLEARLADKPITLPGGRTISIRGVEFGAQGKRLLVTVRFRLKSGFFLLPGVSGTVYLLGTPRYDNDTRRLFIDDFDFVPETEQYLAQKADWLLHGVFVSAIQKHLDFDFHAQVDPLFARLRAGVSQVAVAPGVTFSASFKELRLSGIHVGQDALFLQAHAVGDGRLDLSP